MSVNTTGSEDGDRRAGRASAPPNGQVQEQLICGPELVGVVLTALQQPDVRAVSVFEETGCRAALAVTFQPGDQDALIQVIVAAIARYRECSRVVITWQPPSTAVQECARLKEPRFPPVVRSTETGSARPLIRK